MKLHVSLQRGSAYRQGTVDLEVEGKSIRAAWNGRTLQADWVVVQPGVYSLLFERKSYTVHVAKDNQEYIVTVGEDRFQIKLTGPRRYRLQASPLSATEGNREISAPMPGKIVRVLVREGQAVEAGSGILVIEAMKMQNEIASPQNGRVIRILVKEGATVETRQKLMEVEPTEKH